MEEMRRNLPSILETRETGSVEDGLGRPGDTLEESERAIKNYKAGAVGKDKRVSGGEARGGDASSSMA